MSKTRQNTPPEQRVHTCSICGEKYTGWGNNAQPVNSGRCCDPCNVIVINRRIALMYRIPQS
jgi:hypothetical protein